MTKNKILLILIIAFVSLFFVPIIINGLMFSQDLINVHGSEDIWISSLASYFGAIIGGVVSGALTLIGVRLTIKEQRRIMSQEKIDKAKYIYTKILPVMFSLNDRIKNDSYLDIELIEKDAKRINSIVEEYSTSLRETELEFINNIEAIQTWVVEITTYFEKNVGKTDQEMRYDLNIINSFIQTLFKGLELYFKKYN